MEIDGGPEFNVFIWIIPFIGEFGNPIFHSRPEPNRSHIERGEEPGNIRLAISPRKVIP